MLVTVTLSKPLKHMTEADRHDVIEFFWRQLPKGMTRYDDATTFVLHESITLGS